MEKGRKQKKKVREASKKAKNRRLTPGDISKLRLILLSKRSEILGNVNEIEGEALKRSRSDASGDLSSMPIHMADIGTDNYQQEFALELMNSERNLLYEIDGALRRIEEGTYGLCEMSGEPIKKARLLAQPWARYCVECAKKVEQEGGPAE